MRMQQLQAMMETADWRRRSWGRISRRGCCSPPPSPA
uniref:Uncharacterized protein n=1 Tax=Setaria italica TaxID=4555 RepID=K3Y3S1_SETIT